MVRPEVNKEIPIEIHLKWTPKGYIAETPKATRLPSDKDYAYHVHGATPEEALNKLTAVMRQTGWFNNEIAF